jgi:uncharacterized membrane protein
MKMTADNYMSQSTIEALEKRAFRVWAVATGVVFLWVAAIVLAPVLESFGVKSVSQPVYRFFSYICHQIDSRSFHFHDHQFAVCARCFGFYAGFLAGFFFYPLSRQLSTIDSFPRVWLFAAMIPMGIDVSLTFFGIWENTHLSRTVTGLILGIACAFFIVPALVEIEQLISRRFRKTSQTSGS